ncbi:Cym1 protein [Pichia kluyveri]|uniref:Presequence protease, mitochondrial n=1 Tax=Pichia kluyveri TaxID=36015 RepID=A0AAV5RAP1_PICKL|nr:Cym1 protein [Pichia kluyveri]
MLSVQSRRIFNRCSVRKLSTAVESKYLKKYPIGSEISGYKIERLEQVPEFNLVAVGLEHQKTGSKHLHIDRQDNNNVFSIIFKTNTPNNTGLPHILEHTTLCGSEKYPVRDPFFKMLNRSLSNFMNAMTGHDYTFYPFSTTNVKDFNNLMDIYLDATLHPLLTSEDFYQEGWRLENESTKDKNSPLTFKGVVYNEMKGQVSDSSYYFWIKFQEAIYPSLNNSGGDPSKITDLSHSDLIEFHSSRYHPSNSRTFTYGNIPLKEHLEKLDKAFIPFGKRPTKNVLKQPIDYTENVDTIVKGPVDPMLPLDEQYKTSLTWKAGVPTDIYETFLVKMASSLLMDGHSSPLYQELIESGYGNDFSVNSGSDSITAVNLFTIGLNGLTKEKAENLQEKVYEILRNVKNDGFPDIKVQALIHQMELSKKVENSSFGMNILSSLVPNWVSNVDPMDSLKWDDIITRFKTEYAKKGDALFKEVLDKYIIDKPYFKYTMEPNENFANEVKEEEETRLKKKIETLSEEDKQTVYDRGLKLLEKQEEQENLSCLPTVHVSDIAREVPFLRINNKYDNGIPIQSRLSPKTNGLSYFKGLKTIKSSELTEDLIPYLPLFSSCLTNLGTTSKSMADLENEIKLYTGGLSANFFTHASAHDPNEVYLKFGIGGVSLNSDFKKMLSLWEQLLLDTNFDNIAKLSTLIKSCTADNLSDIVSSGHSYARSAAISKISNVGKVQELLGGIENIKFMNEIAKFESNGTLKENVIPQLKKIQEILLNSSGLQYNITTSKDAIKEQESEILKFSDRVNFKQPFSKNSYDLGKINTENLKNEFVKIPSHVGFSSAALNTASYSSKDSASLQILSQLLSFRYLHSEIREKGGAYGGGASLDALNGVFSFYSYRDPKPFNSLNVYDKSVLNNSINIKNEKITEEDLEQAKLTIFQRIEAPKSVRDDGMSLFNYDIDDELKQERRYELLDATLEDVLEVSDKYFKDDTIKSRVVIGHDTEDIKDSSDWVINELS